VWAVLLLLASDLALFILAPGTPAGGILVSCPWRELHQYLCCDTLHLEARLPLRAPADQDGKAKDHQHQQDGADPYRR